MATRTTNSSVDSREELDLQEQEQAVFTDWWQCFKMIDFLINSPESIVLVSDEARPVLELLKHKLEDLMERYEEESIKEVETRV
jgi:hypothetical protein